MMIDDDLHARRRRRRVSTQMLERYMTARWSAPLTANIRPDQEPLDHRAYEQRGGYAAARKARAAADAGRRCRRVKDVEPARPRRRRLPDRAEVELRADGTDAPHPKYLVVNADEMEPGTFKDRLLMEGDPHQLDRRHDPQRLRDPGDVALHLPALGVHAGGRAAGACDRGSVRGAATSARISSARVSTSSCTCTSAPGATSAAKRPRC